MCTLYVALRAQVDSKSTRAPESWLEHNNAAGQNAHQQRQRIHADCLDVVHTAKDKVWKYVNDHMNA